MDSPLTIRLFRQEDIPVITSWARDEGFAPGVGDVAIYHHSDRQGLWVGWLGTTPVGCIAGVRYNDAYGFIGLFLVAPDQRGKGYGVQLWQRALQHLANLPCIGLEAAPDRIHDYAGWGFQPASTTTRWRRIGDSAARAGSSGSDRSGPVSIATEGQRLLLLQGADIPQTAVQIFDASREASPRPHFLSQWLGHPSGTVVALVDPAGTCHGFGRIRPCLLKNGEGWRIGPLLADRPELAQRLLEALIDRHPGVVLIDAPGANPNAALLLERLGFQSSSQTLRMYRGTPPSVGLHDVYGLACLELG
jgi:ribosomal-protein-alanine N-acetyltransferase